MLPAVLPVQLPPRGSSPPSGPPCTGVPRWGARGRAGGAAPAHSLQHSGRAAWGETLVAQEGASPCLRSPCTPGSVPPRWPGCVSPTGLGARRAAHLSSRVALVPPASGSPHCSELRHHVPRPFLFPANLRGELCLTPASKSPIAALFSERVNNSLTSFLPMVFFLFYHLGLLGLN